MAKASFLLACTSTRMVEEEDSMAAKTIGGITGTVVGGEGEGVSSSAKSCVVVVEGWRLVELEFVELEEEWNRKSRSMILHTPRLFPHVHVVPFCAMPGVKKGEWACRECRARE